MGAFVCGGRVLSSGLCVCRFVCVPFCVCVPACVCVCACVCVLTAGLVSVSGGFLKTVKIGQTYKLSNFACFREGGSGSKVGSITILGYKRSFKVFHELGSGAHHF